MSQTTKIVQQQVLKQQQVQRLSAQHMLLVKLLEMPLTELEQSINAELDDNPALETEQPDNINENDNLNETDNSEEDDRKDELDAVLQQMGSDDELPSYDNTRYQQHNADYEEIVYGDTLSFYDKISSQLAEHELTEKQRNIIEYLIGSLDDDGLLRKPLDSISDELAIYHNIDASEQEIEETLKILQDFDPAGIGARSLQECLLIQIERNEVERIRRNEGKATGRRTEFGNARIDSQMKETNLAPSLPRSLAPLTSRREENNNILHTIIADYFEAFKKKHWHKIQTALNLSDAQVEEIQREIRKLNPKPGASMGETQGRNTQQITPDFIVDTNDDGTISFSLNNGQVPDLYVSPSFTDMLAAYKDNKAGMSRSEKEALIYAKEKVERAQSYIDAVKQRHHTLSVTMKAIIDWQRRFFQEGDEAELRPMILKDIADKTGLDISTISRVSNVKYAQTKWGTFPLRFFFSDGYTTDDGEELSTRKIKLALKELIDKENRQQPMSDDLLAAKMKELGFPIARRTVSKYREQMGIPVARMRKC